MAQKKRISRKASGMHAAAGEATMIAYLMLNVYAETGGNPSMWMASGSQASGIR